IRGAQHRSEPAYIAAECLDGILERYTGRRLTRSEKRDDIVRFVSAVLKIADPHINRGTISGAIQKQVKLRHEREKTPIALSRDETQVIRSTGISSRNFRDKRRVSAANPCVSHPAPSNKPRPRVPR